MRSHVSRSQVVSRSGGPSPENFDAMPRALNVPPASSTLVLQGVAAGKEDNGNDGHHEEEEAPA